MKPKIGIFGLSGCWGEQIVILNCEDQLLDIVGAVDIVDFLGGSSVNDRESRLDIAFVEGSVANAREEAALRRIRERADARSSPAARCACFGGVSAMDAQRAARRRSSDTSTATTRPQPLGHQTAPPACPTSSRWTWRFRAARWRRPNSSRATAQPAERRHAPDAARIPSASSAR